MTRINIGIAVQDLCDQHLVAEYRELPRMQPFAVARLEKFGDTGPRPLYPTLNAGHMAYFIPYGLWLQARFGALLAEMAHRGFAASLTWRPYPAPFMQPLPAGHAEFAAPALEDRIRLRLSGMRPRWSGRLPPSWVGQVP